jgi:hypothetical protein
LSMGPFRHRKLSVTSTRCRHRTPTTTDTLGTSKWERAQSVKCSEIMFVSEHIVEGRGVRSVGFTFMDYARFVWKKEKGRWDEEGVLYKS